MLKTERHAFILRQVNPHNKMVSTDISLFINVSDDTISRDPQQLAEEGKVIKTGDGAPFLSFSHGHHAPGNTYGYAQKRVIKYFLMPS